jgi:branched-chain amino acid transport system permease protein
MDLTIFAMLAQDGVVNGAIYVLLAVVLVLVYAVTRIIFLPQGEFVSFGALTLASLAAGRTPGTAWLLVGAGLVAVAMELVAALRARSYGAVPRAVALYVAAPVAIALLTHWAAPRGLPLALSVALTLLLVVPLGPILYRIAYRPLENASILVLLIASVGVHFAMTGLGLLFFGAEGARAPVLIEGHVVLGDMQVSGQSMAVVGVAALLIIGMYLLFEHTVYGKALRATAVNRRGARLVGISTSMSGSLTFALAALIGALSGVLIGSLTTIFYDSGFLLGLKGFVAAIIGGLASYPVAAFGALLVGLLESYSSFWASQFKEVIVFTLIIPVLVWRSMTTRHVAEEE